MANTLGPASIPFIACVFLLVALILHVLAFASPFWASDEVNDFGLWKYSKCMLIDGQQDRCYRYVKGAEVGRWLNAVRGLESIAIILWSIPLVIIPVYIYVAMGLYYRGVMVTLAIFSLVATLCNIVGVIIYGAEIEDNPNWDIGWCLIVCAAAGAFGIIATFFLIIAVCVRPKFELQRHFLSGFYVDPDRNRMYVVENLEEPVKPPISPGHVNPTLVAH